MKKFSVVLAAVVLLGFLLAWNPGISQAQVTSTAYDPAQLATASILPVKVSSKTETILILFRDSQDTATGTGTAGDIKLTFYSSACAKGNDVTTNLTRGEVQLGDDAGRYTVGTSYGSSLSLFSASGSGVVLGYGANNTSLRWGMSGLVVDGDLGAIYETQGYPALTGDNAWGGFSAYNFEDYYLKGSGFTTTIQLVCPDSTLDTDMSTYAPIAGTLAATAYEIPAIHVYKSDETLINSIHDKTCSCFTEDPGSISTVMALNADVLGLFHIDMNSSQDATGLRVVVLSTTAGNLWYQGRIRRSTTTDSTYSSGAS